MTVRDNEERLGVKNNQADAPLSSMTEESKDPVQKGLSISVPTEFVDLPSGGRFYPEGHPLYGVQSVEIRFMTAKEEDILNSRALIKKGVAIDRMLQSLIIDSNISTSDMLVGDKNALTIAARISGYGEHYGVKVECPSCGEKAEHSFNLEEQKVVNGGVPEELKGEVEETQHGTFLIKLPKMGNTVEVRLLTGKDEKKLSERLEYSKKNKKIDSVLTEQLKLLTVSIDGVTNVMQIANFLENIPAMDAGYLRKTYAKLVPNVDLTQEFVCSSCAYSGEMEVPITVGFFWPDR